MGSLTSPATGIITVLIPESLVIFGFKRQRQHRLQLFTILSVFVRPGFEPTASREVDRWQGTGAKGRQMSRKKNKIPHLLIDSACREKFDVDRDDRVTTAGARNRISSISA